MRYTYLGDKLTDPALHGLQCNPVMLNGKCVVSQKMATALVVDAQGKRYVVARRRLRLNAHVQAIPDGIPTWPEHTQVRHTPSGRIGTVMFTEFSRDGKEQLIHVEVPNAILLTSPDKLELAEVQMRMF